MGKHQHCPVQNAESSNRYFCTFLLTPPMRDLSFAECNNNVQNHMNIQIKRNTSLSPFLRCSKDPQIYICILSHTIPYTYYGFCTNWGAVRFELVPEFRFDTSISLSIRYIFCSEVLLMSKKISAFSQLSKIQILYLVCTLVVQLAPSPSIPPVCYSIIPF